MVAAAAPTQARWFEGIVVGVSNGDAAMLFTAGQRQVKIRLSGIAAQGTGKAFG